MGLAPGLSSLRPSCRRTSAGIGPVAAPPVPCSMVHITMSPYCSPEQDPFLLLESSLRCIEHILRCHVNQPLRRSWIEPG